MMIVWLYVYEDFIYFLNQGRGRSWGKGEIRKKSSNMLGVYFLFIFEKGDMDLEVMGL